MKKFILFVYGAIALISTLWFISALYRIIFVIKRVSDDYWWLLIPIIFSYVALFTVLKKPSLIDKYKKAWSFFTIPLFITIIISLSLAVRINFNYLIPDIYFIANMGVIYIFAFAIIGLIISTVLGLIGLIIDIKK